MVGSPATGSGSNDGRVFVYEFDPEASSFDFTMTEELLPWNPDGRMGESVSINGDTLMVGVGNEHFAYLYRLDANSGRWYLDETYTTDDSSVVFSHNAALGRSHIAIAKETDDDGSYDMRGSLYTSQLSPPARPSDETIKFKITSQDSEVPEHVGTVRLTVTMQGVPTEPVSVELGFGGGFGSEIALGGSDPDFLDFHIIGHPERVLEWQPTDSPEKFVDITINDDVEAEPEENFRVRLYNQSEGTAIGNPGEVYVIIQDNDDFTLPFFTVSPAEFNEGAGPVGVNVTLNGTMPSITWVKYTVNAGTATHGLDYIGVGGFINWSEGDPATKTISLDIRDDLIIEGDETLTVELVDSFGIDITAPLATVTIKDDDAVPLPPMAPTNLRHMGVTSDSVVLDWDDESDDETGFKVQRSDDDGATFNDLSQEGSDTEAYTDSSVSAATDYVYRVVAINAHGSSPPSNELEVTTLAASTGGTPPTASFTAAPTSGQTPLPVVFTSTSTDTGGTIVAHLWNFGDGQTSAETNPTHGYTMAGTFNVTLTVTDDDNNQATSSPMPITATYPSSGGGGTPPVAVDTDSDGIPDWWEFLYGMDPTDDTDGALDFDGDGVINAQEYADDTDPLIDNAFSPNWIQPCESGSSSLPFVGIKDASTGDCYILDLQSWKNTTN